MVMLPILISTSMLAVMTLNVGYFCSVLGGVFLGELAVGRYIHGTSSHLEAHMG